MSERPFKTCINCFQKWNTANEFLEDSTVELVEYQVNYWELTSGLFIFNHKKCNAALDLTVNDFSHLKHGPIFFENKAEKDGCPGYCLYKEKLDPCQNTCECRWVRDVIQVIRDWEQVR